jgi:hypothetical protein
MKRVYLLSYKLPEYFALHDWIDYDLQIEIVWFWGLFKTQKVINYRVYSDQLPTLFHKHWDNIIKNRLPLIY